ncbi:MAG: 2-methylthioadenine synthetase [Thermofilum sp. ex4484_79]|nr:MAG: 2-methylthioadenine synthetase [Thermofilum sp. ex4484_79]
MKKVYLETYGCWLNKGESEIMKDLILEKGGIIVDRIEDADVVIINTCAVREETEYNMLKRIKKLEQLRKNLGFKLIVAGCLTNVRPYTILEKAPSASLIEPDSIHKIPDIVFGDKRELLIRKYERDTTLLPKYKGGIRYILPIQSGCLGNCAFCIGWVSRGRDVKSYPPDLIVKHIEHAVKNGVKEIILTGQDIATYGLDKGTNLVSLLEMILDRVYGEYRIRLGMMEPWITKKFCKKIGRLLRDERIFKYIHLPIQSGDNKILSLMRRKYTVEEYEEIVRNLRECLSRVSIVSDIIVGFPGEKEENFLNTVKMVKRIKFDKVHVARYSLRPFTYAYILPQVAEKEKKRRSKIISDICAEIAYQINKSYIGEEKLVLIEERGKKENSYIGRTIEYKPVIFQDYDLKVGDIVKTKIIDASPIHLAGKIIG